ncbi:hypothetical protein D8S78_02975 [Natrialba swarupiae]|nr:hypothetical protein [Natrialba swarupiae]
MIPRLASRTICHDSRSSISWLSATSSTADKRIEPQSLHGGLFRLWTRPQSSQTNETLVALSTSTSSARLTQTS